MSTLQVNDDAEETEAADLQLPTVYIPLICCDFWKWSWESFNSRIPASLNCNNDPNNCVPQIFGGGMMEEGLIEYLQKYADELEAQAGAPDLEIRAKINELKVVPDYN